MKGGSLPYPMCTSIENYQYVYQLTLVKWLNYLVIFRDEYLTFRLSGATTVYYMKITRLNLLLELWCSHRVAGSSSITGNIECLKILWTTVVFK